MSNAKEYNVRQLSSEWFELRKSRITSSKLGFLIYAKTEEEKQKTARQIVGLEQIEFTEEQKDNMKIGTECEKFVREYFEQTRGIKIRETGIFISDKYSFLGGSPDGMLENGDIIEIKISNNDVPRYFFSNFFEISPSYYLQMQMNCYLSGAKRCHFLFYSRKSSKLYTRTVPFNSDFFEEKILYPCIDFYENYLIPLIKNEQSC